MPLRWFAPLLLSLLAGAAAGSGRMAALSERKRRIQFRARMLQSMAKESRIIL